MTKPIYFVTVLVTAFGLALACSGEDGKDGAAGPAGAKGADGDPGIQGEQGTVGETGDSGPQGEAGPQGEVGEPVANADGGLTTGCLSPCHGFNGIVEQWKTSTHYATYISNLGGEEVDSWTGPSACGNCHAIDGIEQRVGGHVGYAGTTGPVGLADGQINYKSSVNNKISESTYGGQATVAVVHCSTCHDTSANNDPHLTGETYSLGSFPLRVPHDNGAQALLERSSAAGTSDGTAAGDYGVGNACVWCHKSRKDVTNYVLAGDNMNINSSHWGPHEGPHADVYTGKGGYQYSGKTYENSSHANFTNGCVDCHMAPDANNQGVGNHSFYPQLATCQKAGCHTTATDFDVAGGQKLTMAYLQRLRERLDTLLLLTREEASPFNSLGAALADTNFNHDQSRPQNPITTDLAGALYNYLLVARGGAKGVHNPVYSRQLLYDSIEKSGGDLTGLIRP